MAFICCFSGGWGIALIAYITEKLMNKNVRSLVYQSISTVE